MITSYIIGIVGVVALMISWVAIQSIWRRVFAEHLTDQDVLAERRSCSNCGCTHSCKKKTKQLSTE